MIRHYGKKKKKEDPVDTCNTLKWTRRQTASHVQWRHGESCHQQGNGSQLAMVL